MNSSIKTFIISLIVVFILPAMVVFTIYKFYGKRLDQHVPVKVEFSADHVASTDHTEFDLLKQDFETPHEVTEACITCHTGRAEEVMATSHWTWEREAEIPGRGKVT